MRKKIQLAIVTLAVGAAALIPSVAAAGWGW